MKKIKCPNCGEEFQPTRSGYDSILKQVRDQEFQQEIDAYKAALDREKESAIKEASLRAENRAQMIVAELTENRHKLEIRNQRQLREFDERYRSMLRDKDEQIAQLRDFRARQSTKMVGESLERHCEAEFNRIRSVGFQNACFEKDNDAKSGSKGDYIYREFDDSGVEIISIMFEMKNECDTTATKKKNIDFLKELDKDRRQKKCEYAVLVSMLEMDDDFYNGGIADVSHHYEKMYVVRPQCFISIITLLRNAALNTMSYKKELAMVKGRNVDMAILEQEIEDFKAKFGNNFRLASERFGKAIEEIDKTIAMLQRVKEDLLSSDRNLRLANDKAQNLTIEKSTKTSSKKKSTKSGKAKSS